MLSVTTSVRLPVKLNKELEQAAHSLRHGKNWIIKQALEEFLARQRRANLADEARRQSILASRKDKGLGFEDNIDITGWR